MQDGRIGTTGTNTRVRHVTTSSVGIGMMLKQGFQLVFHHAHARGAHDFGMGHTADPIGIPHDVDFGVCLVDTTLGHAIKEGIDRQLLRMMFHAIVTSRHGKIATVTVPPRQDVQSRRRINLQLLCDKSR